MSDINKLLEIASQIYQKPQKEKKVKYTEVHQFILDCNIKAGDMLISNGIIYERYREWKRDKNLKSRKMFFKEFIQFFERKRDDKARYYMLDPTPFDLSDQMYETAKRNLELEKNEEKSIKDEVPGIKPQEQSEE